MTEDDAKTKRCCGPPGCGKNAGVGLPRMCIGSHCMGWQWIDAGVTKTQKDGRDIYNRNPNTEGYCGLAGKP